MYDRNSTLLILEELGFFVISDFGDYLTIGTCYSIRFNIQPHGTKCALDL